MTTASQAQDFKTLTDEQLAAIHHDGDTATQKAVIRELDRRDRNERALRVLYARRQELREEHAMYVHADFLLAEAECNGYLLSREGLAAGVDPIRLWAGDKRWAYRMASEELRNFWDRRPRITITEYVRQAGVIY